MDDADPSNRFFNSVVRFTNAPPTIRKSVKYSVCVLWYELVADYCDCRIDKENARVRKNNQRAKELKDTISTAERIHTLANQHLARTRAPPRAESSEEAPEAVAATMSMVSIVEWARAEKELAEMIPRDEKKMRKWTTRRSRVTVWQMELVAERLRVPDIH